MQNYEMASAYVAALTGKPPDQAIIDVRMLHDIEKDRDGIPRRGTLPSLWNEIIQWNNQGYGVFVNINEMDGLGSKLPNVAACRVAAIDLDNINAAANCEAAASWIPAPSFAVQSSPGKYHVYWTVTPYRDLERYSTLQRKLRTQFDGDKKIIDASRILRMPGTLHCKGAPYLVTCWALPGYGQMHAVEALEASTAHIVLDAVEPGSSRHDLGDSLLAAPSLDWARYALWQIDPNGLDRADWISVTSAFKQAAWSHANEEQLYEIWSEWCSHYAKNDLGENKKQWLSIRQTQVGWPSFLRRLPILQAYISLGKSAAPTQAASPVIAPIPETNSPQFQGDILDDKDQKVYFKDCFFVSGIGEILTDKGVFMNSTKFNGAYGGKYFLINTDGKTTDEPWKAATRSTIWTIPKVERIRFMPNKPFGHIETDNLGHRGVNVYRAPNIARAHGDITPFLQHIAKMLPNPHDQRILFDYMAHNARFPGYKIPWAPVIQSTEGTGKGKVIKSVMEYVLGEYYVHSPSAKEMVESGSQFNGWMQNKLLIIVDEIRVDERRDMIEVLKPWITEERIEVQSKGKDQKSEDNRANWLFFSNYKDAIPISENSRRFAIFYSALQSAEDVANAGMTDAYFTSLLSWLKHGGFSYIAEWLHNYPIEEGAISMRAPETSSHNEVLHNSRGPVENAILDAIEDGLAGFRGGYVSMLAAIRRVREATGRNVAIKTVQTVLELYGYKRLGRAPRAYFEEDPINRTEIFAARAGLSLEAYGVAQGYR